MNKKIKYCIGIVCIAILVFSIFYIFSEHEYDLTPINEIQTDEEYKDVKYDEEYENTKNVEKKIDDDTILGTLIIDKINLKATVKDGSTDEILSKYIGHIENTAKYDGNVGLAAHNRGTKYAYFARINELEEGDKIIYKTKFNTRTYTVNKKKVIYDTDWTDLKNTKENIITLITCIKNKPNQRLCVQAIEKK